MSGNRWTPEARRAHRARCRAENRCIYCQNARDPGSASFCTRHLEMYRRLNREGKRRRRAESER